MIEKIIHQTYKIIKFYTQIIYIYILIKFRYEILIQKLKEEFVPTIYTPLVLNLLHQLLGFDNANLT